MKERPVSVTVICWVLIGMNALSALTVIFGLVMGSIKPQVRQILEQSPVPIPVQYATTFAGLAVITASAIAMLCGRNWGRWLYVIWMVLDLAFGVVTSPMKLMMIPGALVFALITVFLFRPAANQYFKPSEGDHGPESI